MKKLDTRAPKDLTKQNIKAKTQKMVEELAELQNLLFAESKHSLLVVIQGMDGKRKGWSDPQCDEFTESTGCNGKIL